MASDDGGAHFTPSNAGFTHRLVLAFAVNPSEPNHWLARFASGSEPLETRDAGQTWQSLRAPSAGSSAVQFFGTSAGWFAGPAEGGLFRYDESARQWRAFRFVTLPSTSSSGSRGRKPRTSGPPPLVHDLRVVGSRLFLLTSRTLWSGELLAADLHALSAPDNPSDVAGLDVSAEFLDDPAGSLRLVTPAGLFEANLSGQNWRRAPLPPDSGDPRWLRYLGSPARHGLLLGTTRGVYWQAKGADAWQHLAGGLPAIEMLPIKLTGAFWLAAGKAGGLYLSRDLGASWTRIDGPGEAGLFLAAVPHGSGFVAASRTEGLLRWTPHP
jgi:photosystem II stability/assembly factor-like uncharacterized protein